MSNVKKHQKITKMTITLPLEEFNKEEAIDTDSQKLIDEINLELREAEVEIRKQEYETEVALSKIKIDGFKI